MSEVNEVSSNSADAVGVDLDEDRARGYTISDDGITVVGKGITVRR